MKISVASTVDGFIAREEGALDWLPAAMAGLSPGLEDEDFGYQTFMDSVDVLVMGRKHL